MDKLYEVALVGLEDSNSYVIQRLNAALSRCQALTVEPPEEVKRLKEVVLKFLCATYGSNVCTIDLDEVKKEQDQIKIQGRYHVKSRFGRSRHITFNMILDKQNQLISYARGRMV